MRAHPGSKAAPALLSAGFDLQEAQPASRESRAFTEKQSINVVDPQEEKELSQMILRPLSRNIPGRPSHLIDENNEVKDRFVRTLNILYEEE